MSWERVSDDGDLPRGTPPEHMHTVDFAFWTGAGRYEINRQIGQGGMVTVYLAA